MATSAAEQVTRPDEPANAPLRDWVRSVAGSDVRIVDRSRGYGMPSITWELHPTGSARLFMKRNGSPSHYRREAKAYADWIPQLREGDRFLFPTRLTDNEALRAFVMTAIPGPVVEDLGMEHPDAPALFREAGALARRIHEIRLDEPQDPVTFMGDKAARYLAQVRASDRRYALDLIDEGRAFQGCRMVPTQGDYSPRNWIRVGSGSEMKLGVIDWEGARADVWMQDVQRMTHDHWLGRPHLRSAWFEGYGRDPEPQEERQLLLVTLVIALSAIPWAEMHDDEEYADMSRKRVALVKKELA